MLPLNVLCCAYFQVLQHGSTPVCLVCYASCRRPCVRGRGTKAGLSRACAPGRACLPRFVPSRFVVFSHVLVCGVCRRQCWQELAAAVPWSVWVLWPTLSHPVCCLVVFAVSWRSPLGVGRRVKWPHRTGQDHAYASMSIAQRRRGPAVGGSPVCLT